MSTIQGANSEIEQEKVGYVQVLTDPMYKKASWVGAIMMFFSQLSGINAIFYYSTGYFRDGGISCSVSQYATLCVDTIMDWSS